MTQQPAEVNGHKAPQGDQLQRRPDEKRRGPRRRRQRQDVPQEMLDQTATIAGSVTTENIPAPTAAATSAAPEPVAKSESAVTAAPDVSAEVKTEKPAGRPRKPEAETAKARDSAVDAPAVVQSPVEAPAGEVKAKKPARTRRKPASKAATETQDSGVAEGPRASNDPRKKPKATAKVEVVTERPVAAKTAETAANKPTVAAPPKAGPRASNDPRKKRQTEKAPAETPSPATPASPQSNEST